MATLNWKVGQTVEVQSRTWAGINKPGGCAKITKIHLAANGKNIEGLDVKYVLGGGCEKELDPSIVSPFETLERGGRSRRGRNFLMKQAEAVVEKITGKRKASTTDTKSKKQRQDPACSQTATSPSTPVTPDHKPKPAKDFSSMSVPSYIIADQVVEVSPLPIDRSCSKPSQSNPLSVARRGLFGNNPKKEAIATSTSGAKSVEHKDQQPLAECKISTFRQPAIKAAMKAAQQQLKKPPPVEPARHLIHTKARPSEAAATATAAPFKSSMISSKNSTPKVASRPKSKEVDGVRRPWEEVFDHERQQARNFMEGLVRTREDDIIASNQSTPVKKKSAVDSRYQTFLSIFSRLRMRIEDGTIEEGEFLKLVNKLGADEAFSTDEISKHVDALCEDGKVMRSDGMLYIID